METRRAAAVSAPAARSARPWFDQIVSWKIVLHGIGLYRRHLPGLTALPYERPAGFSHRSSQASATRSPSGVTW